MPGTAEGAKKAVETVKARKGDDFYREIGKKGGSTPTDKPKGWAAATPEQRKEWGAAGGRKSKRRAKSKDV